MIVMTMVTEVHEKPTTASHPDHGNLKRSHIEAYTTVPIFPVPPELSPH